MTKLSVNINKIATIRNSRVGDVPNVCQVALDCERFGAEGITVHPRPDERHIRKVDVLNLRPILKTEFNIEGYPSPDFIKLVKSVKPQQVTLVPDPPEAITSSAGWDTVKYLEFLQEVVADFQSVGIRVSIFVDTDLKNIESAAKTGTDRVELYTESYASLFPVDAEAAVKPFREASHVAKAVGLGLNAGHDLNLHNLRFFQKNTIDLLEVSIGHALVCDALYLGLENTIQLYLGKL